MSGRHIVMQRPLRAVVILEDEDGSVVTLELVPPSLNFRAEVWPARGSTYLGNGAWQLSGLQRGRVELEGDVVEDSLAGDLARALIDHLAVRRDQMASIGPEIGVNGRAALESGA
jgi:hypothetical protein